EPMNNIVPPIEGRTEVPRLKAVEPWAGTGQPFVGVAPRNQPGARSAVEIAKLKPGPGVQVLAYDREVQDFAAPPPDARPVMVQAPCGLGRVVVCAFDLDQTPFTAWKVQARFWDQMKVATEPATVVEGLAQDRMNQFRFGNTESNELAGKLVHTLEAFPDVPVISFGWVALFILVYIIIVGP